MKFTPVLIFSLASSAIALDWDRDLAAVLRRASDTLDARHGGEVAEKAKRQNFEAAVIAAEIEARDAVANARALNQGYEAQYGKREPDINVESSFNSLTAAGAGLGTAIASNAVSLATSIASDAVSGANSLTSAGGSAGTAIASSAISFATSVASNAESLATSLASVAASRGSAVASSWAAVVSTAGNSAFAEASSIASSANSVAATAAESAKASITSAAASRISSASSVGNAAIASASSQGNAAVSSAASATSTPNAANDLFIPGVGVVAGAALAFIGLM